MYLSASVGERTRKKNSNQRNQTNSVKRRGGLVEKNCDNEKELYCTERPCRVVAEEEEEKKKDEKGGYPHPISFTDDIFS